MRQEDGTFKIEKGEETFTKSKHEIRISFMASDGKSTVECVCFTKVATEVLDIDVDSFASNAVVDQKNKIKEILYETKILTIKKQRDNFLLLNVEDIVSHQTN